MASNVLTFRCGQTLSPITELTLPNGASFTVYNSAIDTTYGPYNSLNAANSANIFFPDRTYIITFSAKPTALTVEHATVHNVPYATKRGTITPIIDYKLKLKHCDIDLPIVYNITSSGDYTELFLESSFVNDRKLEEVNINISSGALDLSRAFAMMNETKFNNGRDIFGTISLGGTGTLKVDSIFESCEMTKCNSWKKITDLGTKVTSAVAAFRNCYNLVSVAGNSTGSIPNITEIFKSCTNLNCGEITCNGTSGATKAFYGCSNLRVPPKFTNENQNLVADYCLYGCTSLDKEVTLPNASSLMGYLMNSSVKRANFATSKVANVRNLSYLFAGCTSLKYYFTNGVYPTAATDVSFMFMGCNFNDFATPYTALSHFTSASVTKAAGIFKLANGLKNPNCVWRAAFLFPNITSFESLCDTIRVNNQILNFTFDFEAIIEAATSAGINLASITSIENMFNNAKIKSYTPIFAQMTSLANISGCFNNMTCESENRNLTGSALVSGNNIDEKALETFLAMGNGADSLLSITLKDNKTNATVTPPASEALKYLKQKDNYKLLEDSVYIVFHKQYPFIYDELNATDFSFINTNLSIQEIPASAFTSNISSYGVYYVNKFLENAKNNELSSSYFGTKDMCYIPCKKFRVYDINNTKELSVAVYMRVGSHTDPSSFLPLKTTTNVSASSNNSNVSGMYLKTDTFHYCFDGMTQAQFTALVNRIKALPTAMKYNIPAFASNVNLYGNTSDVIYTYSSGNPNTPKMVIPDTAATNSEDEQLYLRNRYGSEEIPTLNAEIDFTLNDIMGVLIINNNESVSGFSYGNTVAVANKDNYRLSFDGVPRAYSNSFTTLHSTSKEIRFSNSKQANVIIDIGTVDDLDGIFIYPNNDFHTNCNLTGSIKSFRSGASLLEGVTNTWNGTIINTDVFNLDATYKNQFTNTTNIGFDSADSALAWYGSEATIPYVIEGTTLTNVAVSDLVEGVSTTNGLNAKSIARGNSLSDFNTNAIKLVGGIKLGNQDGALTIGSGYAAKRLHVHTTNGNINLVGSNISKLTIDSSEIASNGKLTTPVSLKSFNVYDEYDEYDVYVGRKSLVNNGNAIDLDFRRSNEIRNYVLPLVDGEVDLWQPPYFGNLADESRDNIGDPLSEVSA